MKLIAHRGLTHGPDKHVENSPYQICRALSMGFDCEVDLWVKDQEFFLGHDGPEYHTTAEFLDKPGLWIHAKNLEALRWLTTTDLNYFWHQEDDFVIKSKGYIWTYPGKPLSDRSVAVMPEWNDPTFEKLYLDCYGICSDYVSQISSIVPNQ